MKSKKRSDSTVFKGIRKPTAPPSHKIGAEKPAEKVHPTGRKAKHKKKEQLDGDL